jgi:hypothetical protein
MLAVLAVLAPLPIAAPYDRARDASDMRTATA